jgi:hypothetical protein
MVLFRAEGDCSCVNQKLLAAKSETPGYNGSGNGKLVEYSS